MIFMCLQLLCYFGASCRAGRMAVAQGDSSFAMVPLSTGEILYFFISLHFCYLQNTWGCHIVPLRFTINMKKTGNKEEWWNLYNTLIGDIDPPWHILT